MHTGGFGFPMINPLSNPRSLGSKCGLNEEIPMAELPDEEFIKEFRKYMDEQ
jgi:hypothetical protein